MSFWFTPVGIILPIVLQPLLIAVYRFFIIKKPLPAKKAKLISIIYTVVTFAFIGIISNGDAFFQGMAYFFLWFLNFPILITTRNKPLIREGFVNFFLWSLASCFCTFLFILILVVCGISTASVIVGVFLIFPLWFFLKNRINDWTEEVFFTNRSHDKNKDETDFENKWQGKLDRERFEKDKDGR